MGMLAAWDGVVQEPIGGVKRKGADGDEYEQQGGPQQPFDVFRARSRKKVGR